MFATAAEILSLTPGSRCLYFMISLLPLGQLTELERGSGGVEVGEGARTKCFQVNNKSSTPKLYLEIRFVAQNLISL